jgi:hypothetical protein
LDWFFKLAFRRVGLISGRRGFLARLASRPAPLMPDLSITPLGIRF